MRKLFGEERFNDMRLQWPEGVCIHCGTALDPVNATRGHIPSKCLLRKPYPKELMIMGACRECNTSFSRDEEYLSALLNAVLAGTTDPDKQKTSKASRMFRGQANLRARIEKSKVETKTHFGEIEITFTPERERVNNVIVKNARCHALYELDQAMFEEPDHVFTVPLHSFSEEQCVDLEAIEPDVGWAEIGTFMFIRQCYAIDPTRSSMLGSWVIVQDDVYRYAVVDGGGGLLVRTVIEEYLATEVYWNYSD